MLRRGSSSSEQAQAIQGMHISFYFMVIRERRVGERYGYRLWVDLMAYPGGSQVERGAKMEEILRKNSK